MTEALDYDELPEGSDLRREFDGRGGVTIFAPAGDLSPAVRRSISRQGLMQGVAAFGVSIVVGGVFLFGVVNLNRIDPALRLAAIAALGVLCFGLFLFAWWGEYMIRSFDLVDARRRSTVLHADCQRVLVETVKRDDHGSLSIPTSDILCIEIARESLRTRGGVVGRRTPVLKLQLRDGSSHRVLEGHHDVELWWVAGTLSEATGVATATPLARSGNVLWRWLANR